jgi:tight adherence protein B
MRRAGAWAAGLAAAAVAGAVVVPFGVLALTATAADAAGPTGSQSPQPAVSASASPASVGVTGRIQSQSSKGNQLQVTFSAVGLAAGQSINLDSVQVFLDQTPVPATAVALDTNPVPSASPDVTRTAVLVVDISGSMRGAGLAGAKQAANAFLAAVPPDVQVGLITVSTTASVVAAPTTNRAVVAADVNALVATGNTALYDGTLLAEKTVGTTGSRTIVLLTDGHDDGSKASLAEAVASASDSGATLDAVSFGTAAAQVAPLQQLTAAAGGRLLATEQAADFAPAFRRAAQDIATEVLITAQVPSQFDGKSVTVSVDAVAGGTTITDSAAYSLSAGSVTAPTKTAPPPVSVTAAGPVPVKVKLEPFATRNSTILVVGLAAIFVGITATLTVLVFNASVIDSRDTRVRRRLSFYTLTGRGSRNEPQSTALGDSSVARSAVQLAGRLVVSRDFDARLARRLDAAGVPLKPAEWIVVQSASAIGLGVIFVLLGGGSAVAGILGVLIGIGVPIGYLVIKEARRSSAFLEQLPDTLQLIAGSLLVGHSLPQAMDAVVREERQPVSIEFNRALVETRLGMPVEDALEGISTRMDSQDFAWIVMAIKIQREVGGNLAEILTTVAATIRERERLRRQVRGLSAEGRLSAWILGGLPPVFATYLVLVRPGYIAPLFTDPLGIAMLVLMVVLMVIGAFWLSRVIKVEV